MTEKSNDTKQVSAEQALEIARAWATPENLARLDATSDHDVAHQISTNPDAAPELTDSWFDQARLVIPLKARRNAA